jgi:hypothetical protein
LVFFCVYLWSSARKNHEPPKKINLQRFSYQVYKVLTMQSHVRIGQVLIFVFKLRVSGDLLHRHTRCGFNVTQIIDQFVARQTLGLALYGHKYDLQLFHQIFFRVQVLHVARLNVQFVVRAVVLQVVIVRQV